MPGLMGGGSVVCLGEGVGGLPLEGGGRGGYMVRLWSASGGLGGYTPPPSDQVPTPSPSDPILPM